MIDIEKSPDGRWWISRQGWGRPIGLFCHALSEAKAVYPHNTYQILDNK